MSDALRSSPKTNDPRRPSCDRLVSQSKHLQGGHPRSTPVACALLEHHQRLLLRPASTWHQGAVQIGNYAAEVKIYYLFLTIYSLFVFTMLQTSPTYNIKSWNGISRVNLDVWYMKPQKLNKIDAPTILYLLKSSPSSNKYLIFWFLILGMLFFIFLL